MEENSIYSGCLAFALYWVVPAVLCAGVYGLAQLANLVFGDGAEYYVYGTALAIVVIGLIIMMVHKKD